MQHPLFLHNYMLSRAFSPITAEKEKEAPKGFFFVMSLRI
jgi:hypothetical protein